MSDKQEKQFIGRVSQIQTTYGPLTKVGISQEDFNKHVKDGWVNFMIKTSKEGKVYLQVDDWVPDPSKKKGMSAAKNVGDVFNTLADMTRPDNDLPF